MWEEVLNKLPPEATIVFVIALAILVATRQLGFKMGVETPLGKSETAATVAAVIVDSTALNTASAAVEGLNITLTEYNILTKKFIEVDEELREELSKLREEVRLTRELNAMLRHTNRL